MAKIFMAGVGGMLGEAFHHVFKDSHDLCCTDKDVNADWLTFLDFRDRDEYVRQVEAFAPDYLFHIGAHTSLELCEQEVGDAYATNTLAVENAVWIANRDHVLSGTKHHVPDGADADWFIIPARTSGAVDELAGISLFLIPRDAPGLKVERFRAMDHHRHARLTLDGVVGSTVLGEIGGGGMPLGQAVKRAVLAHCAEAVGAMDALREITLDYLKTRQQFGQAIGSFQALQHRMVDIAIACEEARSITYRATLEAEAGVMDKGRMASAAKARVGQCGLYVGRQAVQLHGGVGVSDELVVGHYYKRLMMLDLAYGNADHHKARFAKAA